MKFKSAGVCRAIISILAVIIVITGITTHSASAIQQNINNTNMTSRTPVDIVNVIKKGEQAVNIELDKARAAIQSNNSSQALQLIEEAKQHVYTLSVCATSAIQNSPKTD